MSEEMLTDGKVISRRRFFLYAWVASVLIFAGQAVGMLLKFIQPRAREGEFGGKITGGKVEEFPVGSISYIRAGRFYIHICRGDSWP